MSKNKTNQEFQINDEDVDTDSDIEITEDSDNPNNDLVDFKALEERPENENYIPVKSSALWNDYVMSKFVEDELVPDRRDKEKKYPNVAGLRRVVGLLVGTVIENVTEFRELNSMFAVAESSITIRVEGLDSFLRFGDVGNCSIKDTKSPYDAHLPSIAATRAESRALRKALELKTLSAEEMAAAPSVDSNEENDNTKPLGQIQNVQITAIQKVCERNGLNYDKFVRYKCGDTPITEMTDEWGRQVLSDLHSYQAKKKELPQELKNGS